MGFGGLGFRVFKVWGLGSTGCVCSGLSQVFFLLSGCR